MSFNNSTSSEVDLCPSVLGLSLGVLGAAGLLINALVVKALGLCGDLTILYLMRLQCSLNCLGLLPYVFYSPAICLTNQDFLPHPIVHSLVGFSMMAAVLAQQALQVAMGLNRLMNIGYRKLLVCFERRNSLLTCTGLVSFGVAWAILNEISSSIIGFRPERQRYELMPVPGREQILQEAKMFMFAVLTNLMILVTCVAYRMTLKKLNQLR